MLDCIPSQSSEDSETSPTPANMKKTSGEVEDAEDGSAVIISNVRNIVFYTLEHNMKSVHPYSAC